MPRGLTTPQKQAIAQRVCNLAYFVALDLPAGFVRVWNGRGSKTTGGNIYTGLGELGIIDGLKGDRSLKSQRITLALAGLPGDLITPGIVSETRAVRYQGRPLSVACGIMDKDTDVLIDGLIDIWRGGADVLSFQLGATATVALTATGLDTLNRRPNGWNMSTVSHNARLGLAPSTDMFFEAQDRLMGVARPGVA